MVVRLGLSALGLFYLVNGAWMILAPNGWYAATPGVSATGPMNPHFIRISVWPSWPAGQV